VISGDLWAGAESQTHTLLRSLARYTDIELSAVLLNEGKLAERLRSDGINPIVIEETKEGFFAIRRCLTRILSEIRPEIIHSHRYKENILASLVARECGARRLVQTVHGVQEGLSGLRRLKMRAYQLLNDFQTGRRFDSVIAVSEDIRRVLSIKHPQTNIVTIHNGIDLAAIKPCKPMSETRLSLGLESDNPLIGSVGRLVPVKAYDVFLRSAAIVRESCPDAHFLIAGDGPLRGELESMADGLRLGRNMIFTGFRDDILDIVNALDIYVVSSQHEGIPMSVLEAMALAKPIVSTAVGGMTEIIEKAISGALVEPGSDREIANTCLWLLGDKSRIRVMGDEARARVQVRFSAAAQCKKVYDLYRELLRVA
jgi:glycosyltransferase involved in cell wall biosynthesis